MSPLCFSQLMMKLEEEEASPLPLYRSLLQVMQSLFSHGHKCLGCVTVFKHAFRLALSVTVFTESSDSVDNITSQSVPMASTSTVMTAAADEGDEVFVDQEEEE